MKLKAELSLTWQISSDASILLVSVFFGLAVFSTAVLLQLLIYDDWLH